MGQHAPECPGDLISSELIARSLPTRALRDCPAGGARAASYPSISGRANSWAPECPKEVVKIAIGLEPGFRSASVGSAKKVWSISMDVGVVQQMSHTLAVGSVQ